MNLSDLVDRTRMYSRDTNSFVFEIPNIISFINEAIERVRQYNVFEDMEYLSSNADVPTHLPPQYHYILSLYAASRCMAMDERFYESVELRNEFETIFSDLISEIQTGNITIYDGDGNIVEDGLIFTDAVKNVYFEPYGIYDEDDSEYKSNSVAAQLKKINDTLHGVDQTIESIL